MNGGLKIGITKQPFTTPWALVALAFLTIFSLNQNALCAPKSPNNKRNSGGNFDPFLAAQSAYLHRDYDDALKFSNEALRKDPKRNEARRLGAKAARELRQYLECLRLTAGIEPRAATVDDVQLVGECSVEVQVTPNVVQYMQRNLDLPEKRSMASYWLGVFSYQRGEHVKAQSYLRSVSALPSRLERERINMLGRIQLLLSQQPPPNHTPTTVSPPTPAPLASHPAPGPSPNTGAQPAASAPPAAQGAGLDANAQNGDDGAVWMNRALLTKDGQILSWDFSLRTGLFQRSFSGEPVEQHTLPLTGASTSFQVAGRIEGRWGYARKSAFGLGVFLGLSAQQGDKSKLPYFSQWDLTWPQIPTDQWIQGADATPGFFFGIAPNGQFNLLAKVFYKLGYSGQSGSESAYGIWGAGVLNWEKVYLKAGSQAIFNIKSTLGTSIQATEYFFDVQTSALGRFAIVPLPGHPFLRYFVVYPRDAEASSARFMDVEGAFFELNLSPRVNLAKGLWLAGLFRYVLGSNRSYVSPALRKALDTQPRDFSPSAAYQSSNQQWQARACYDLRGGQVGGGVSFYEARARFSPQDLPQEGSWEQALSAYALKGRTVFVEASFEL